MTSEEIYTKILKDLQKLERGTIVTYITSNGSVEYSGFNETGKIVYVKAPRRKNDKISFSLKTFEDYATALSTYEPLLRTGIKGDSGNKSGPLLAVLAHLPNIGWTEVDNEDGKSTKKARAIVWSDKELHPIGHMSRYDDWASHKPKTQLEDRKGTHFSSKDDTEVPLHSKSDNWIDEEWALAIVIYNLVVLPQNLATIPTKILKLLEACTDRSQGSWGRRIGNIRDNLQGTGNFTGGGQTPKRVNQWQEKYNKEAAVVKNLAAKSIENNEAGRKLYTLLDMSELTIDSGFTSVSGLLPDIADNKLLVSFMEALATAGYMLYNPRYNEKAKIKL